MKSSEIFEGENSSLRKTFDSVPIEATETGKCQKCHVRDCPMDDNCNAPIKQHCKRLSHSEPIPEDWADGRLTFDDIKNILDICNVNNVKIKQDSLLINFVPKNVIGKVWRELRGKMHQTIER